MAFLKLFFKRVQGIRDNYLLQEGDIALDEDDFQLYRGDGSTVGGIAITSTGGTSADSVSTGNGTDVTVTGGESTASGSTGGNTIIQEALVIALEVTQTLLVVPVLQAEVLILMVATVVQMVTLTLVLKILHLLQ